MTRNDDGSFFPLPFTPAVQSCAAAGLDRMTMTAAIRELAQKMNVVVPGLQWSATRRGKYRWGFSGQVGSLIMGPNVWRGYHTLIHEFAHHVDRERQKAARPASGFFNFGRRSHHGDSFSRALADVCRVAFRDINEYAWNTEYRMVQAWWRRNGYAFGRKVEAVTPVARPTYRILTTGLFPGGLAIPSAADAIQRSEVISIVNPQPVPVAKPKRFDPWRDVDRQAKALGFCRGAGPGYRADLIRFCIEHKIVYPGQRTAAGY